MIERLSKSVGGLLMLAGALLVARCREMHPTLALLALFPALAAMSPPPPGAKPTKLALFFRHF